MMLMLMLMALVALQATDAAVDRRASDPGLCRLGMRVLFLWVWTAERGAEILCVISIAVLGVQRSTALRCYLLLYYLPRYSYNML